MFTNKRLFIFISDGSGIGGSGLQCEVLGKSLSRLYNWPFHRLFVSDSVA